MLGCKFGYKRPCSRNLRFIVNPKKNTTIKATIAKIAPQTLPIAIAYPMETIDNNAANANINMTNFTKFKILPPM